ncbi:MAG: nucleotidyltransferase domain-containing protein [Anaerolineae bacterium]
MSNRAVGNLLACLSYGGKAETSAHLALLNPGEWQDVTQLALQHGLAPLLYQRLKQLGIALPAPCFESLKRAYLMQVARNLRLYHALGSLLQVFNAQQIPVVVLKGAHLAELVYGNVGLRGMVDVDLLARQADLARIDQLLLERGYKPMDHHRVIARDNRCFDYTHPDSGSMVEIHWTIAIASLPFTIDVAGLWARAQAVNLVKVPTLVLSPEDLLLHLCLHTAQHADILSLSMLCDIGEVVRCYRANLDWQQVAVRARAWGITRAVYVVMRLAQEFLDVAVPGDWLLPLVPADFDEHYFSAASRQIITAPADRDINLTPQAVRLWQERSLLRKLALLLHSWLLPRVEMSRMYPAPAHSWRIYPYYVVRLRDMLRRHLQTWWSLARGNHEVLQAAGDVSQAAELRDWLMSKEP